MLFQSKTSVSMLVVVMGRMNWCQESGTGAVEDAFILRCRHW